MYLRILRLPRLARLLGANLLARLPIGINALAIILFLRAETGSFSVAGLVAGALALGSGSGAPLQARLVDRHGRRVLIPLALAHATGLLSLLALGTAGAPPALLALTALAAGLVLPPISSVMRARYPTLLGADPALVRSGFALDSVLTELIFTLGPLLTALLVATLEPQAALVLSAAAVVSGTVLFVTGLPPAASGAGARGGSGRDALGALRSPASRTRVLATLPIGFAFGAIEVALPAFATTQGRP